MNHVRNTLSSRREEVEALWANPEVLRLQKDLHIVRESDMLCVMLSVKI